MKLAIDLNDEVYNNIVVKNEYTDRDVIAVHNALMGAIHIPKGHGRLIDADAFADSLKEVSVRQRYEELKIDQKCTVADVIDALICDLKGTALGGCKLCPTIIEADKESKQDDRG